MVSLSRALFVLMLLVSCGSPATGVANQPQSTTSPVPSLAAPSPPSSPTPSAAATPTGFVLPQGCSYVGAPVVTQPSQTQVTTWQFNCGTAPDGQAIERLSPAFTQQGWTLCSIGQGSGFWWKGTTQTVVGQSAIGNPVLSQLQRQNQDCP